MNSDVQVRLLNCPKNISLRFLSLVLDLRNVLDYCPVFNASLFSASVFWLTVSHLHPESDEIYFNPFFHLLFHCVTGCHTNQKHNRSTPELNSWQGGFFSIFFFWWISFCSFSDLWPKSSNLLHQSPALVSKTHGGRFLKASQYVWMFFSCAV